MQARGSCLRSLSSTELALVRDSAANLYGILGQKISWRFRFCKKEFLIKIFRRETCNPVNENFNGVPKREFLGIGNFHPDPALF
jgi:hypothetical protein